MRGKQIRRLGLKSSPRNIPAHAGKTHQQPPWPPNAWEHPRACGENALCRRLRSLLSGTSPRMRGKHLEGCGFPDEAGNIPAHAGKTASLLVLPCLMTEHPRACGENPPVRALSGVIGGTSPRMRGKHPIHVFQHCHQRNIPAHAGKTLLAGSICSSSREHPRACGENGPVASWRPKPCGTSPRMRGKPQAMAKHVFDDRNIPAHAGKTGFQVLGLTAT